MLYNEHTLQKIGFGDIYFFMRGKHENEEKKDDE